MKSPLDLQSEIAIQQTDLVKLDVPPDPGGLWWAPQVGSAQPPFRRCVLQVTVLQSPAPAAAANRATTTTGAAPARPGNRQTCAYCCAYRELQYSSGLNRPLEHPHTQNRLLNSYWFHFSNYWIKDNSMSSSSCFKCILNTPETMYSHIYNICAWLNYI